jgi:hypothetical protein
MRRISILLLTSLLLLGSNCGSHKPTAGGQRDIIVVLADRGTRNKIEDGLEKALSRVVFIPTTETIYELRFGLPENLPSYIYGKNILLVGPLDGLSESSKLISSLLTENAQEMVRNQKAFIFEKENPWAIGQYLLIITTPGKPDVAQIIDKNSDVIFNYFEEASLKRAKWLIYSAGRLEEKEKKLKEKFNFTLELPTGFYWYGEDSIETFAKFVRKFPYRLISVGWQENTMDSITFEDACSIRDSIGKLYFENDMVDREETKGGKLTYLNREGYKLEGIWRNDEKIMGGAFRTYFLNDTLQERCYIIDIHVYAPAKKKWFYLKELEGVASTFETYPEKISKK